MAHVALIAQPRTELGSSHSRRLRRRGLVPGIVYQPAGAPAISLTLPGRDLRKALVEGRTGVIDLTIGDSQAQPVLVKDWQLDPIRGDVLHVDFQQVDLTQEVEVPVSIVLVGDSIGVRDGGVMDQPVREVLVSALPDSLPDHLEIDVAALDIGDSVAIADLTAPAGVTIVSDPETVVASVVAPSKIEEPAEAEEAEEAVAEPTLVDEDSDSPEE